MKRNKSNTRARAPRTAHSTLTCCMLGQFQLIAPWPGAQSLGWGWEWGWGWIKIGVGVARVIVIAIAIVGV